MNVCTNRFNVVSISMNSQVTLKIINTSKINKWKSMEKKIHGTKSPELVILEYILTINEKRCMFV